MKAESVSLVDRIPDMTDVELAALHANAIRLSEGDSTRRAKAEELLPALEIEVAARKDRKSQAKPPRPPAKARRAAPRKIAVAKVAV